MRGRGLYVICRTTSSLSPGALALEKMLSADVETSRCEPDRNRRGKLIFPAFLRSRLHSESLASSISASKDIYRNYLQLILSNPGLIIIKILCIGFVCMRMKR